MSTSQHREPTNDQLWAQPPADPSTTVPGQGLAPYAPTAPAPVPASLAEPRPDRTQFVLAIVSLGVGVPLSGIGGGISGLAGLLIVWVGIVLVNLVYGWTHRRH
ncbi:MAG TPA: hypothetical protein VIK31_05235 [Propionibacteriaceae bacterium]